MDYYFHLYFNIVIVMEDIEKLNWILNKLEDYIENKMRKEFESSELYTLFKDLIYIECEKSLERPLINHISILTDDIDCFNFHDVKDDIKEIKRLLKKYDN